MGNIRCHTGLHNEWSVTLHHTLPRLWSIERAGKRWSE